MKINLKDVKRYITEDELDILAQKYPIKIYAHDYTVDMPTGGFWPHYNAYDMCVQRLKNKYEVINVGCNGDSSLRTIKTNLSNTVIPNELPGISGLVYSGVTLSNTGLPSSCGIAMPIATPIKISDYEVSFG